MFRRKPRLVPAAAFSDRERAEAAWAALADADIPASVVTDPATFGAPEVTRVYVEQPLLERAQAVIADALGEG